MRDHRYRRFDDLSIATSVQGEDLPFDHHAACPYALLSAYFGDNTTDKPSGASDWEVPAFHGGTNYFVHTANRACSQCAFPVGGDALHV